MVSGTVRKVVKDKNNADFVRLTVRGTGCEKYNELDVRIRKDGKRTSWFFNALGKEHISVWWHSNKLFASFGELSGYEFEKVSTTSNFVTI